MGSGQSLGAKGEVLARRFLEKAGYRIIDQNYRTRFGEVDLIALDGITLVFVEVKTRSDHSFGAPQEAVTRQKQQRIIRVAQYYLSSHQENERPVRFDVVAITDSLPVNIELFKDAFSLD